MPHGLVRYQNSGCLHFITFSCYSRRPYLASSEARDLLEHSLERIRLRYQLWESGYVVMPEHVHLLLSEPFPEQANTVPSRSNHPTLSAAVVPSIPHGTSQKQDVGHPR